MSPPEPAATSDDRLPPWKRRLFIAISLCLPLVLLGLLEVGLRLFGWGGYPDFIRPVGRLPDGSQLCLVEYGAFKPYFFANPTRPGYTEASTFVMPKPPGTVRIFLVGESAAKGYPQPSNLAMSSFLQAMLQDAWPDRRVEVINLGTTAVASFPLIYQVRQALQYQPDLMVFYVGNNEFFGAYGVASINASGGLPPAALPLMRAVRGLATVQAVEGVLRSGADADRTLMEQMIGQTFIPADAPLREAAAKNLRLHLGQMLTDTRAAGVPAIVCTTASNEAGMAPLGEEDTRGPGALAEFRRGEALAKVGDRQGAREAFLKARDLDTMPWRPTSQTEQAIRDAAAEHGAVLCDVAERFREISEQGATGWKLLDDHVHPSLEGQAEVARSVVRCMASLPSPLGVSASEAESLPSAQDYAARLGSNPWDDFRVAHTIRTLLGVPFMRRNNPEALARAEAACRAFEAAQPASTRAVLEEWKTARPHAGGMRPLTGMVARVLLREQRPQDAESLYRIAQRQVPEYTSWWLEYVYFTLACQERRQGTLDEAGQAAAAAAIAQGRFLLAHGNSESGLTERYIGRLHQLRGEWAEAIPPLLAARPRMNAEDLVACDQALCMSYRNTGNRAAAVALCDEGIRNAGRFAGVYRQMRAQLGP